MSENLATSVLENLESVRSSVLEASADNAAAMNLASSVVEHLKASLDMINANNKTNLRGFIMMMPNNVCRYIWANLLSDEGLAKIAFEWKTDSEFCDFLKGVYTSK